MRAFATVIMAIAFCLVAPVLVSPSAPLGMSVAHAQTGEGGTRFMFEGIGRPGTDPTLQRQLLPQTGTMRLQAVFGQTNAPIASGLIWRVFEDRFGEDRPVLVARSDEPRPEFQLIPGNYIVHVSYGYASATRRITMQWSDVAEILRVSAGALSVRGVVADNPVSPSQISYSVYVPVGDDQEGRLVAANVRGDEMVRLPEGNYHVVSTFGEANSIMRTDVEVETGQVTEATLNHRAATVTLKLVGYAGGEAYAGTAFSVLTPGGDVVREAIGAFPSVTLAEGEYVVIARHDGAVYTRDFAVQNGLDRDIEVLAGQ
ncbi:MAG: hypothetical protein JJU21_05330 [Salinarimonas sp.]|nr:hypothetical protein [Salinarimonas sp.]